MKPTFLRFLALAAGLATALHAETARGPVRFNTAFEGAALDRVEVVAETEFRVYVPGQQDERGRNRQATWYYFRMDNVRGREVTITLTGFLPGEYNDRPSAHMNAEPRPVFSHDGERWQHVVEQTWDDVKKEGRFTLRAETDSLWVALVPPYPHSRLVRLLGEVAATPHARVEVVGRSVLGRELPVVTVTDFATPDAAKKTVWLQARDHAWESPTSFVMEGALKFAVSDDPAARALRQKFILMFTPMVDPDGSALGRVRFNANGYDLNRHWDSIDLRDPTWLQRLPEVWYYKKAIRDYVGTGRKIALFIHLHNTISEYMSANAPTAEDVPFFTRFHEQLVAKTQFDPSRALQTRPGFNRPAGAPVPWWVTYGVPAALIELRIAPGKKLGGSPTAEHRLAFGRELLTAMAGAVE
jgi:hypothetical protein